MASVLVTGGLGFIGSAVARGLLGRGHAVMVLDNLHPQVHATRPQVPAGAQVTVGDVRDGELVARLVEQCDVVVHLAAETGTGQSEVEIERYVSANTLGTATLIQALTAAGRRRHLVLASSRAVYGEGRYRCGGCGRRFVPAGRSLDQLEAKRWDPWCPGCGEAGVARPMAESSPVLPTSVYGWTKLQQEQLVAHAAGVGALDATMLRCFNVYGPGQSPTNPYVGVVGTFVRALADGRPVELYEDGAASRDFVFVDDVVGAFVDAVDRPPVGAEVRVLNIGSGVATTLTDLAAVLAAALGTEPRASASGRFRIGDVRHAVADLARARRFGWSPTTDLPTGIARYARWALAHPEGPGIDGAAATELRRAGVLRASGRP